MDSHTLKKILRFQKNEITEHWIYKKLALVVQDPKNKAILEKISGEELGHYQYWKQVTGKDVPPDSFKISIFTFISRLLGLTFGLKLMEKGEEKAQVAYQEFLSAVPEARRIEKDEEEHEKQLLNLLNEEMLQYVGSAVLGLNDALVELTGALAGFTLALQNTRLVAMVGFITGIAASFSMTASEYLSTKSEGSDKNPWKACFYTGTAYIFTVLFLIFPFLIVNQVYLALGMTLFNAVLIILIFTFYTSVAKDLPFKKRFLEMLAISFGVAALTFGIGYGVRKLFNVEI